MKKLFIGNIPGEALLVDIYEFLGGLELRADFHARQGKDCERNTYHYVVAELSAPEDIEALIDQYNGITFQGRSLAVREYQERNPCPDVWAGVEHRVNLH